MYESIPGKAVVVLAEVGITGQGSNLYHWVQSTIKKPSPSALTVSFPESCPFNGPRIQHF